MYILLPTVNKRKQCIILVRLTLPSDSKNQIGYAYQLYFVVLLLYNFRKK